MPVGIDVSDDMGETWRELHRAEIEARAPAPLVWFSCGAASAVAARLAVQQYGGDVQILYCDTLAYEHPDNPRFMRDVSGWCGSPVRLIRSRAYSDIYDVFERTGWLVGPSGARCTLELKKRVRRAYQVPGDLHIFGHTADERHRIDRFESNEPDIDCEWILADIGYDKEQCYQVLRSAGIDLPMMYRLGFNNNNCIGCVKGGMGYWNKIRDLFPSYFERMAAHERKAGVAINKRIVDGRRERVFLDRLPPGAGRDVPEPPIDCGVICEGAPSELIGIYDPESPPVDKAEIMMLPRGQLELF